MEEELWELKSKLVTPNLRSSQASIEYFFNVDFLKLKGTNTTFKILLNLMNIYTLSLNTANASTCFSNGPPQRLTVVWKKSPFLLQFHIFLHYLLSSYCLFFLFICLISLFFCMSTDDWCFLPDFPSSFFFCPISLIFFVLLCFFFHAS